MPSPSDHMQAGVVPPPVLAGLEANRAVARLALGIRQTAGASRISTLREGGGYRIKFPESADGVEAVLVNTGGGLLGGDTLDLSVTAEIGSTLMMTTQSAEKVYRAAGAAARIATRLSVEAGARLFWMPQETILFSGARLVRTITADVAADGELFVAESNVFGRLAMGEVLGEGLLRDSWRIRRGGNLVFADDLKLEGALVPLLDRPALGGGARAVASLVLIAADAELRLDAARALIDEAGVAAGASAWDGKLTLRLMAADPAPLRRVMARLIPGLSGRALPRFW